MQTLGLAMFAICDVEWFDFTSKSYMSIAVWNASEIESQMSCWNWFTSYRQHVSNWLPNNLFMNHSTNEYLFIKVFILEVIVGSVKDTILKIDFVDIILRYKLTEMNLTCHQL